MRTDKAGNSVLCVSNFSSVKQENYKIGVERPGVYTEVFSTDDAAFGGEGITNGKITAKKGVLNGREYFLSVTLPPFSTVYFYKRKPVKKVNKK